MCSTIKSLLYYPITIGVLTVIIYGLWWVHNDHPFVAAVLTAVLFMIYEDLGTHLLLLRDIRIAALETNQKRLLVRLEEDEQHIEELTADEDDSAWG